MSKNGTIWFYNAVLRLKDADETANSGDPDQTALKEQSDLDLHCLLRPACPIM